MIKPNHKLFNNIDIIKEFAFRSFVMPIVPGRWLNPHLPKVTQLTAARAPIHLEIVSHCWKYTQFELYQLSSLVLHPPSQCDITFTVFYSTEDTATVRLLDFFKARQPPRVHWNFIALPKASLFRRAIGRNLAAKSTRADWIWFTDCDVVFLEGSLDHLAIQLEGRQDVLVYPKTLEVSQLLDIDDPLIQQAKHDPKVLSVDRSRFTKRSFDRATGPIQIMHADVARACGYCESLGIYQKPSARWLKAYEDRAMRWLLGTQGTPIEVPNLLFIRHAEKGRYVENSRFSRFRQWVRKTKSRWFNR